MKVLIDATPDKDMAIRMGVRKFITNVDEAVDFMANYRISECTFIIGHNVNDGDSDFLEMFSNALEQFEYPELVVDMLSNVSDKERLHNMLLKSSYVQHLSRWVRRDAESGYSLWI